MATLARIAALQSERAEEFRFSTIVGMDRVEKIVHDLLTLDDSFVEIRQLHFPVALRFSLSSSHRSAHSKTKIAIDEDLRSPLPVIRQGVAVEFGTSSTFRRYGFIRDRVMRKDLLQGGSAKFYDVVCLFASSSIVASTNSTSPNSPKCLSAHAILRFSL